MNKYRGYESNAHLHLKKQAVSFLEQMGCYNIRLEVRFFPMTTGQDNHWKRLDGGRIEIDVVGETDNKIIGIECGGFQFSDKRGQLLQKVFDTKQLTELYILPYRGSLYKWNKDLIICHMCGHQIGENGQK